MAPARSSFRRGHRASSARDSTPVELNTDNSDQQPNADLFIDPMHGCALAMYVDKDVHDKDEVVRLIIEHGGTVSPGYSGVPYILVDPHRESGQSLFRMYAGKKGKLVLASRWVYECIRLNALQTFFTDWAGCKLTGKEPLYIQPPPSQPTPPPAEISGLPSNAAHTLHPHPLSSIPGPQAAPHPSEAVHPAHYSYSVFAMSAPSARSINAEAPPPQSWETASAIVPQQTQHMGAPAPPASQPAQGHMPPPQPAQSHIPPPAHTHAHMAPSSHAHAHGMATNSHIVHRAAYREETSWDGYSTAPEQDEGMNAPPPHGYEYRYREDQGWVAGPPNPYYDAAFDQPYAPPGTYMDVDEHAPPPAPAPGHDPDPGQDHEPTASTSEQAQHLSEPRRGRRKTRSVAIPAPPASQLVANRHPPARSPTPPTRVIKSTYGGNLFTVEDVLYLKKYIDYCQEQGLVLSLREICERIAIKAPHHTFYSWRRYCNKHQIRLGGYMMNPDRSQSPNGDEDTDLDIEDDLERELRNGLAEIEGDGRGVAHGHQSLHQQHQHQHQHQQQVSAPVNPEPVPVRARSPTPPKALFRSTTGKGVAFTEEDVTFLTRFLEYRKSQGQGKVDMVKFWKDVAVKAPHHSRASWMKFWRRHKHELERTDGDAPLPLPPDKKMRYSRDDDILLARFFCNRPPGTSDKVFQAFAREHPHHPWKGWQEHHRIHKAKIDHLISLLAQGMDIEGM